MTALETRQKIYQQIEQLLPDQLGLLAEFLDFLQFKSTNATPQSSKRKAGLHPESFIISDDFDEPLPDSFWLGEE